MHHANKGRTRRKEPVRDPQDGAEKRETAQVRASAATAAINTRPTARAGLALRSYGTLSTQWHDLGVFESLGMQNRDPTLLPRKEDDFAGACCKSVRVQSSRR